jgi:hypothetical protein
LTLHLHKIFITGCILATALYTTPAVAQNPAAQAAQAADDGARSRQTTSSSFLPPHPPSKMGERYYDIDAKRASGISAEDMLPRSREFKRIDSTYYVGWQLEGQYKYEHAADFLGFKNAAIPLEKALALLEHDYAKALATRTSDIMVFYPNRFIVQDYTMIAYLLMTCYTNTDQPEKAFALLRHTLKWKLQMHYYMDTYNFLAWTVHRNRFYTHDKYSFLKNSIDENEKLANSYLDTCLMLIQKNRAINEGIAKYMSGGSYEEREKMSVYHYKNILYSYAFNIDSASYYFELMRKGGRLPHNNYANFRSLCGDFKTAEEEYTLASSQDAGDKRLQEWVYFTSILDIYKALPRSGVMLTKNMIKANGSTPGYGWYNIALSRCMMYDGQISESQRYIDRAAEFKEVHIGTTLGQSHYDFAVQLMKLINKEQVWQMDRFENSNWWYNPSVLMSMAKKLSDKYMQQFLIINQFAQNPERERVIYKLFSAESVISWDEVWYLVHDFSAQYFITRFQKAAENDNRPLVRKYFKLFVARLQMQEGKYALAKPILDKLVADKTIDEEYEKLFIARVYQALAECAKEQKNDNEKNNWLNKMYELYPQLIPFTGLKMNMGLHLSGEVDPVVEKRLRGCNINWVTNSSIPAPQAYIVFGKTGNKKDVTYYVLDRNGNYLVNKQSFFIQKPEETAKTLAYRLFNIGSKDEEDKERK